MKRSLLPVAALTLAVGAACAQGDTHEPSPAPASPIVEGTSGEDVEGAIMQLERDWVSAIVNKDAATLERLLADDFAGTSPSAHTYTKKMAIDDLTTGVYTVQSMTMDEVSVNTYGNTAVAFASQDEKSRYGNADISGHYHYTNVWVKKDGRWQAVASHGTRYNATHQPRS